MSAQQCNDCGKFMKDGTWAEIYDYVNMSLEYDHYRCRRCTEKLGPAKSNARPRDGDMSQYQGVIDWKPVPEPYEERSK